MSLSKLGSTSGPSSQVSVDGQNPCSEKQHPLLLPTVLDTIFSYLTLKDLKSSRLVCKTWSEIGVPIIGRKQLKPVSFSSIPYEDFLALKQEFIKYPNKVKLFQGFEILWDEMSSMVYCNFLASFKPSQLAISDGNVHEPSAYFVRLLQPVLNTLTSLSLNIWKGSDSCASFITLLNNLTVLQPLTLKELNVSIYQSDGDLSPKQLSDFFRAFERVLDRQNQTLVKLAFDLGFKFKPRLGINFGGIQLQLPIFPQLEHLELGLKMSESDDDDDDYSFSLLAPFDFCVKFPQIVTLQLADSFVSKMEETLELTRGHPLKKLRILWGGGFELEVGEDLFHSIYSSFPYIEKFTAHDDITEFLLNAGSQTWVDTLRKLEMVGLPEDFHFGHLKKLEYIHYKVKEDIEDVERHILTLIEIHSQLPQLKGFKLTYLSTVSSEQRNEIQEGLPTQLQAILTIDD